MRKYETGDIPRVEWLDHLAFREIENLNKVAYLWLSLAQALIDVNLFDFFQVEPDMLYLYVDLPKFDFPVVFSDKVSSLSRSVELLND
jgi:phosphatidylinositol 3-kinase